MITHLIPFSLHFLSLYFQEGFKVGGGDVPVAHGAKFGQGLRNPI